MKITFLGTAAYDAIPALFCNCELCQKARKAKGKNIRTRTQAMLDGDLLLDFNEDTVAHFLMYGIDSTDIKYCVITHNHIDHLFWEDMQIPKFSTAPSFVAYYAAGNGYDRIYDSFSVLPAMKKAASVTKVIPYQKFTVGDYTFLPVEATHDPNSSPVVYAIEKAGKRLFYGHDTGILKEEAFEALANFGRYDFMTFDCTSGINEKETGTGHMHFTDALDTIAKFKARGCIDEHTVLVVNHFSHNGLLLHEDLEKLAKPHGIIVAYDGLEIEF